MTLTVIRVPGPWGSFPAFDGKNATPHDLQDIARREPGAPVLVKSTKDPSGTQVVTANCAAKNMDRIDTSRERRDERSLGKDFDTNLPHQTDSEATWGYVFGTLDKRVKPEV